MVLNGQEMVQHGQEMIRKFQKMIHDGQEMFNKCQKMFRMWWGNGQEMSKNGLKWSGYCRKYGKLSTAFPEERQPPMYSQLKADCFNFCLMQYSHKLGTSASFSYHSGGQHFPYSSSAKGWKCSTSGGRLPCPPGKSGAFLKILSFNLLWEWRHVFDVRFAYPMPPPNFRNYDAMT